MKRLALHPLIFVVPAGAAAAALLFWINAYGPEVWPDSTGYIELAQNLLAGRGLLIAGKPVVDLPPAYPLLLASANVLVPDIVQAARWLQALIFGANVMIVGLMVYWSTGRHVPAAAGSMLLFASSAPLLRVHSLVMSDALFLTFLLGGLFLLAIDLSHPRLATLLSASLVLGLALATRLAGAVLLVPIAASALFLRRPAGARRLRDALIALVAVSAPFGLWFLDTVVVAGGASGREFAMHVVGRPQLAAFVVTLHDFFFPVGLPVVLKAMIVTALLACAGAGLVIVSKAEWRSAAPVTSGASVPLIGLVFAVAYVLFLLASASFFDYNMTFDSRILSPLCVVGAAALFPLARSLSRALDRPAIGWSVASVALISVILNISSARAWAIETHRNGQGYTSRQWRNSEAVAYVRSIEVGVTIYSNDPYAIWFLTGRRAVRIPDEVAQFTAKPNEEYRPQLASMCGDVRDRAAVFVWFDIAGPWFIRTHEDFESGCRPYMSRPFADGTIYSASTARQGP